MMGNRSAGGTAGTIGGTRGGMMGRYGTTGAVAPGPGESGFVAGTVAAPRVVRVIAGPGYAFSPSVIAVARGETVTFEVTSMGGLVHEFMVGPADAVVADTAGTPEIADIGMMQSKSVTVTFDGSGPYAYACHATGHFEAGMRGTITIVG
jgi:plastocyanin